MRIISGQESACLVLLLITSGGVTVVCEIPMIQWPQGCDDYEYKPGVKPHVFPILSQSSSPDISSCRSLCSSRTDCGGFLRDAQGTSPICYLYNINNQIIADYFTDRWFFTWKSSAIWHSKTCAYRPASTQSSKCNSYSNRQYDNEYPTVTWRITYTWPAILSLTSTECHQWCTLYLGCRSVRYQYDNSDNKGRCDLYATTIQDLRDAGLQGEVRRYAGTYFEYTTYDRHCLDGSPYNPTDMTETAFFKQEDVTPNSTKESETLVTPNSTKESETLPSSTPTGTPSTSRITLSTGLLEQEAALWTSFTLLNSTEKLAPQQYYRHVVSSAGTIHSVTTILVVIALSVLIIGLVVVLLKRLKCFNKCGRQRVRTRISDRPPMPHPSSPAPSDEQHLYDEIEDPSWEAAGYERPRSVSTRTCSTNTDTTDDQEAGHDYVEMREYPRYYPVKMAVIGVDVQQDRQHEQGIQLLSGDIRRTRSAKT